MLLMIVITKCPVTLILTQQQSNSPYSNVRHFCGRQGIDGKIVVSHRLSKGMRKQGDPGRSVVAVVSTLLRRQRFAYCAVYVL